MVSSIFDWKEEITCMLLFSITYEEFANSLQKMGGHWGGHWEVTGEATGRPLGGHCCRTVQGGCSDIYDNTHTALSCQPGHRM